jgi:hypothetical protein
MPSSKNLRTPSLNVGAPSFAFLAKGEDFMTAGTTVA